MARPTFWPWDRLLVLRFFTIDLSEYAREFGVEIYSKKRLKNSDWDLGGPPLLAPEEGSVLQLRNLCLGLVTSLFKFMFGAEFIMLRNW